VDCQKAQVGIHKETWWCNEEVAEAVREMKKNYGNWKKDKKAVLSQRWLHNAPYI